MTVFKSSLCVTVFLSVLVLIAVAGKKASHASLQPQESDRVLEIERYPNEPLQLVNLKIGTQSVKDRVRQKFKDKTSQWGIDSVRFNEKHDWFKRVSITLRNTSDKPVFGVEAYLLFKPAANPMIFSLGLTRSKDLAHDPLLPGAEIDLSINQGLLNQTLANMNRQGADLSNAVISFSIDTVFFSEDLRWYRGKLLRPDSVTPGKWVSVDEPLAIKRHQEPVKLGPFVAAAFKPAAPSKPAAPFVFSSCTQWNNSFIGFTCSGDASADCIRRVDLDDNVNPGLLSHFPVNGTCIFNGLSETTCTVETTHTRLQIDSNCQPCPDADGDGFFSDACGGSDCNDSNAAIKPGVMEICGDTVDNNCNGTTDNQDPCECPEDERDIWEASGWDCTLCNDGIDNDCDFEFDGIDGFDSGCNPHLCASPVLVDVSGNGFDLTNTTNGVNFDLNSDGTKERLSWTVEQTDDAWLAFDRNGDGVINNGTELFGNFTAQPKPPLGYGKNGFNALVDYDLTANGGNADGLITERDAVFGKLLLWHDKNHNGISEASELSTLKQVGLSVIECDYKESKRRDQFGNQFRYRAKVNDSRDGRINRWAWDVFLVNEQSLMVQRLLAQVDWRATESILEWLRR